MSKEYIDKSDIISNLEELNAVSFYELNEHSKETYYEIKDMIQHMDGQEVRPHGEWWPCTKEGLPLSDYLLRHEHQKWYGFKCSRCMFIYKGNALTQSQYCQKCGSIMDNAEH